MIDALHIIKKQIISEKATAGAAKNCYVFKVAADANKVSVRQAIEAAYKGTKVAAVRIVNTKAKAKRITTKRCGYGLKSGFKKAIVALKEGKIDLN